MHFTRTYPFVLSALFGVLPGVYGIAVGGCGAIQSSLALLNLEGSASAACEALATAAKKTVTETTTTRVWQVSDVIITKTVYTGTSLSHATHTVTKTSYHPNCTTSATASKGNTNSVAAAFENLGGEAAVCKCLAASPAGAATVTKYKTVTSTVRSVEPSYYTDAALSTVTTTTVLSTEAVTVTTKTKTVTATPFNILVDGSNDYVYLAQDSDYDDYPVFVGNGSSAAATLQTYYMLGTTIYSLDTGLLMTTYQGEYHGTFWVEFLEDCGDCYDGKEAFKCKIAPNSTLTCSFQGGKYFGLGGYNEPGADKELLHGTIAFMESYFDASIVSLYVQYLCG